MTSIKQPHEDGFALVSAIMILFILMMLGLALLSTADVQTRATGHEVAGEASFNLAESVLDAETLQLDTFWPNSPSNAYPPCDQGTTPATGCPGTALTSRFTSAYAGPDFATTPTWNVQVIDDSGGPSYYSDSLVGSAQSYDANGDSKLWVRADVRIGGQRKIVVAQVVRQSSVISLPSNVLTAGGVFTSNNGNKVIIEAKDPNSGLTGTVDLRCTTSSSPTNSNPCAGWDATKGQLDPAGAYQTGYVDPGGSYSSISPGNMAALKQTAIANNTYYPTGTCPPAGTAGVVYVENANCTYNSNATWNSLATPGALIFASGTLTINGTVNFYGILYMANGQGLAPNSGPCTAAQANGPILTVHGGGAINGAVFIDKCGTVDAGSDKFDIVYDSNAFGSFQSFATPALAKNTFRIMPNP
jgi:Tfp pilus assembly protein PilX